MAETVVQLPGKPAAHPDAHTGAFGAWSAACWPGR